MKKPNPGVIEDTGMNLMAIVFPLLGGAVQWGLMGASHLLVDSLTENEYAAPTAKIAADALLTGLAHYGASTMAKKADEEGETDFSRRAKLALTGASVVGLGRTAYDALSLALPTTGAFADARRVLDMPKTRSLLAKGQAGKSTSDKGAVKSIAKPKIAGTAADDLFAGTADVVDAQTGKKVSSGKSLKLPVWADGKKILNLIKVGYDAAEGPFFYRDENGRQVISEDDIEVGRTSEGVEFYFVEDGDKKYVLSFENAYGQSQAFPSLRLNKANFVDNGLYKQWEQQQLFVKGTEPSKNLSSAGLGRYEVWNDALGRYEYWNDALGRYEVWSDALGSFQPAIEAHSLNGIDPAIEVQNLGNYLPAVEAQQLQGVDPAIEAHSLNGYYDVNPTRVDSYSFY